MNARLGRAYGAGTLRKVQRGGTQAQWVLTYTDAKGDRHRVALSTDRRVAEQHRVEIVRKRDMELAGLGQVAGQSMNLAALRDLYLADLEQRAGRSQSHNVRLRLVRVLKAIRAERVRDVRVFDLLQYRTARVKAGAANRTANCDVAALSAMLNWAVSSQLIAANPLATLRPLPTSEAHQRHRRRALSDAEIAAFLQAAAEDDAACAARQAAKRTLTVHGRGGDFAARRRRERVPQLPLWRTLLETAGRYGEITRTTWTDLDVEQRTLALRAETTKSNRTRVIPLRAEIVDEVVALREIHQRVRMRLVQPGDRIFVTPDGSDFREDTTNVRRILRRVLDRAGIARVDSAGRFIDVHAIRHSSATRMARRGVPLVKAQRLLGHASPDMTSRIYTHLTTADLRDAIELAGAPPKPRVVRDGQTEASA